MRKIGIIFVFLIGILSATAQTFSVSSSMDSTILLVGEQTKLTFEIVQPKGAHVEMPLFSDTIVTGLEIVKRLPLDTQQVAENQLLVRQSYLLTAFDSALFFIEELPFVNEGDTQYSSPMSLKVLTIPVDTAQHAIADIKGVVAPPFDWPLFWRIMLAVLCVALVAAGGYFLYIYLKKRRKKNDETPEEPQDLRRAHEIALERLDAIKNEKIWQQNRAKEYYTQVSDVLRDYIVRRYGIAATEQTSVEILADLQRELKDKKETFADLKAILTVSDLVKFAKYKTVVSEDEKTLAQAYSFVDATKEVTPEECEKPENQTNENLKNEEK